MHTVGVVHAGLLGSGIVVVTGVTITFPVSDVNADFSLEITWDVSPAGASQLVDIYIDTVLVASSVSSPYTWTPTPGSHTIEVIAGSFSDSVTIDAFEPTTATMDGNGTTISPGSYSPTWSVDQGSDYADLYQDGVLIGTASSGGVSCTVTAGSVAFYCQTVAGGIISNTATLTVSSAPSLTSSFALAPTDTGMRNDGGLIVGCQFSLNTSVLVSKLGRFYGAGSVGDHDVAVYNASGSVILSGTVLASSTSDSDGMKWVDVTPTLLGAGIGYAMGCYEDNGDEWKNNWIPVLAAVFATVGSQYSGIPGFLFGGVANNGVIYSSPAFQYVTNSGGTDTDATDFFTRSGVTDTTQQAAVNQLVLDLKICGIWSKMIALYPFVGGDAAKHSHNLKSSSFQITWQQATNLTHDANGVTAFGGGGSGDTGCNARTDTTANSLSFGVYNRSTNSDPNTDFAAYENGGSIDEIVELFTQYNGDGQAYFDNAYNAGAGRLSVGVADASGLTVSSRTASNAVAGYKNGASIASGSGAQGTVANSNFLLFRYLPFSNSASHNFAFAFIGNGLTANENQSLYSAVNTYQTALSRNV